MHCDVIGLTSSFWVEMTYKQYEYLRNKLNSYPSYSNKHGLRQFTLYRHFGTAALRDRDDSAPEATFRELVTDSLGLRYRQFGRRIKMKY